MKILLLVAIVLVTQNSPAQGIGAKVTNLFSSEANFGLVGCLEASPDECSKKVSVSLREKSVNNKVQTCGSSVGKCQRFVLDQHMPCVSQNFEIVAKDGNVTVASMDFYNMDKCGMFPVSALPTVEKLVDTSNKPKYIIGGKKNAGYPGMLLFSGIWKGDRFARVDAVCKSVRLPSGVLEPENFRNCSVIRYVGFPCDKDCKAKDPLAKEEQFPY